MSALAIMRSSSLNRCIHAQPQFDRTEAEKAAEEVFYGLFKVLFAAKISLRGGTDACPRRNWMCSISPPLTWQSFAHVLRRSCGARCSICTRSPHLQTTHHIGDSFPPRRSVTAEGCEAFALSAPKRSCGGALFCSSCAYGRPLTAGTRTLAQQTVSTPLSGSAKGSGRRRTTSKQRWNLQTPAP